MCMVGLKERKPTPKGLSTGGATLSKMCVYKMTTVVLAGIRLKVIFIFYFQLFKSLVNTHTKRPFSCQVLRDLGEFVDLRGLAEGFYFEFSSEHIQRDVMYTSGPRNTGEKRGKAMWAEQGQFHNLTMKNKQTTHCLPRVLVDPKH